MQQFVNYLNLRSRYRLCVIRKPCKYWLPGTDVVKEIVKVYGNTIKNNDIIVISDKALSIALGNIYDENAVNVDPMTSMMTFFTSRILWGYLLRKLFTDINTIRIVSETPIDLLAKHKKLALYYGGMRHFLKPLSESGIDATNLPYYYVSIPVKNVAKIIREMKQSIEGKLSANINILVVDTDSCFVPKNIKSLAIATRPSTVKGIIDLGVAAYILGKVFRNLFEKFPTPTAYIGIQLDLYTLLRLARIGEKFRGYGIGRNIIEMVKALGMEHFRSVTWLSLRRVKHYPIIVLRFKKM